MSEVAVAAGLAAAIFAPHLLRLEGVTPWWAAVVWLATLALRAAVAIAGAILILVHLPRAGVLEELAHWCLHEALPLLRTGVGISEHPVSHVAGLIPGIVLTASLLWLLVGFARGWLTLRRTLRRSVGEGPAGATVVQERGLLVAVTGLGRGRIVVSDAALGAMDPQELEASVAHEIGHLERRHRPMMLAAAVMTALGRALPGARVAERELHFQLERDADEYAVARTHDPLALASAICKAATARPRGLLALGGSGHAGLRVGYLMNDRPRRAGRRQELVTRALAGLLLALALAVSGSIPLLVLVGESPGVALAADCHHHHQDHQGP